MFNPLKLYYFLSNPIQYLFELQNKFGDVFPLALPGVPTIWLTSDSELTKDIFTAPVDYFKASEKNPVAPLLGDQGLIMLSGAVHLKQRRELTPSFSKSSLIPITTKIQSIFLKHHELQSSSGKMSLQEFALRNTLKIILSFLFPHLNESEQKEAEALTENFLNSYSASFNFIPKWVPGTWKIFQANKNKLDDRFYEFYLSGLNANNSGPLSKLQNNSRLEILDHIRTFIVAGHETSATSIVWALYYIHSNSLVKQTLLNELKLSETNNKEDFLEQLLKCQYLDAVINETLRIQPPVPFVTRKIITNNFKLGLKEFKSGEEIGVCISLLHRNEKIWKNSNEFDPTRFIEKKYSPYEFAPFGGGTRKCIGAELAILELKILIAHFIKHYDAELFKDTSSPISSVQQITIGPSKKIIVRYRKLN